MMDNISRYWPDYSARAVTTLDDAKQLVRSHKPMDHPIIRSVSGPAVSDRDPAHHA